MSRRLISCIYILLSIKVCQIHAAIQPTYAGIQQPSMPGGFGTLPGGIGMLPYSPMGPWTGTMFQSYLPHPMNTFPDFLPSNPVFPSMLYQPNDSLPNVPETSPTWIPPMSLTWHPPLSLSMMPPDMSQMMNIMPPMMNLMPPMMNAMSPMMNVMPPMMNVMPPMMNVMPPMMNVMPPVMGPAWSFMGPLPESKKKNLRRRRARPETFEGSNDVNDEENDEEE